MNIKPHIYEAGLMNLCRVCYKQESDDLHISESDNLDNESFFSSFPVCELCRACPSVNKCKTCQKNLCDSCLPLHLNGHSEPKTKVVVVATTKRSPCPSHTCIECGKKWTHYYDCGKPKKLDSKCKDCLSQDSVEIARPTAIEVIKKTGNGQLTGQEFSELLAEHDNFVVFELIHDPCNAGVERDNWGELVSNHILDIERKMEILRVKLTATHRAKVKQEQLDLTKLTPEEIEQYKRDSARQKRTEKPKVNAAALAKKKAWDNVLKGLISTYRTMNPKLSEEQAREKALKMIENPPDLEAN